MKSNLLYIQFPSSITYDTCRTPSLKLWILIAMLGTTLLLPSRTFAQCSFDWKTSEDVPALNGPVFAMTVWDDGNGPALYVGGSFTMAGDLNVNRIAKWDGTVWSALGSGITVGINAPFVAALSVYNDELIVGGYFTQASGVSASNIARWNGTNWSPLGSGTNGNRVEAMIVYNGEMAVGGNFSSAGGVSAQGIARWNGTNWSSLGSVALNTTHCLAVYNNDLIAGGTFSIANGAPANRIARWNGTSWSALGAGANGPVDALAVYQSELVAMGAFLSPDNHIAKWNGTSWTPLGSGLTTVPGTIPSSSAIAYNGELIVGGNYWSTGGSSVNHIARWNGSSWSPLATGTNNAVASLAVFEGQLIAGGKFTIAGGNGSAYWARWGPTNDNTTDSDGDGVMDNCDICPDTIPGSPVDSEGCPPVILGDFDRDGDVDTIDTDRFIACAAGSNVPSAVGNLPPGCDLPANGGYPLAIAADFDIDMDVDMSDFGVFQRCISGENVPGSANCAD